MKNNNNSMIKFSPALGIVFGSALGIIIGLLTNNHLVFAIVIGSGIGLVIGSSIYAMTINKNK